MSPWGPRPRVEGAHTVVFERNFSARKCALGELPVNSDRRTTLLSPAVVSQGLEGVAGSVHPGPGLRGAAVAIFISDQHFLTRELGAGRVRHGRSALCVLPRCRSAFLLSRSSIIINLGSICLCKTTSSGFSDYTYRRLRLYAF